MLRKIFAYYVPNAELLYSQIEWVDGDIYDKYSLQACLKNVSEIYHAAGFVSFSSKNKLKVITTNVRGTANMVDLALEHRIAKFCMVSSASAIGNSIQGKPADETCTWKPGSDQSIYAISKFKAEMEVWRGMAAGLNAVIVNPTVIIEPTIQTYRKCH